MTLWEYCGWTTATSCSGMPQWECHSLLPMAIILVAVAIAFVIPLIYMRFNIGRSAERP